MQISLIRPQAPLKDSSIFHGFYIQRETKPFHRLTPRKRPAAEKSGIFCPRATEFITSNGGDSNLYHLF
ncbi:hypothetical protein EUGRSUZ_H01751 [Eucalyptus grandis]|uniref:Uncharacterized protein n=2 Tax=Eucalyptus grandis TaxID=71139 RepID=A0ACC3JQE3_EUCGR|nr:hypothetical protein EUGRSUZ_H01751 [Eucalyptus grandis]